MTQEEQITDLRQQLAAARDELANVERVIGFAESKIGRKNRVLHDWLAQVLQVLVVESGCVPTLESKLAQAIKERDAAQEDTERLNWIIDRMAGRRSMG